MDDEANRRSSKAGSSRSVCDAERPCRTVGASGGKIGSRRIQISKTDICRSCLFHIQRLLFPESNSGLRLRLAGDTATMSAPGGRRSESELLKHRELKEADSPQRTATMCAEAGKIGSRRIPNKRD